MKAWAVRIPTRLSGNGQRAGYLYAKAQADGSWRITDKELGHHDLVGSCDTPEAMIPRLRDHLAAWVQEQEAIVAHNLKILAREPARIPGFRPDRKTREISKERNALHRARHSAQVVLQAIASVAKANGWPIDGYDGPLLDLTAPGVLVEKDEQ